MFAAIATALLAFLTISIVHSLYFHPLANFPGPKLAACTRWYEYYYEVVRGGRFSEKLYKLHQVYGPIIRVNPFEVHIIDSSFYDNLFNFSPELDKKPTALDNLQYSPSFKLHRMRRRAFDPYFSRGAILRLEPLIREIVEKLRVRIEKCKGRDTPVAISLFYRCLTADIVTEYSFSSPYDMMDKPESHAGFMTALIGVFKVIFLIREIRLTAWLFNLLGKLPTRLVPTDTGMNYVKNWQSLLNERLAMVKKGEHQSRAGHQHPTVFEGYMKNESLPETEKTGIVLLQQAQMLISAGIETTGFSLSTATYHILSNQQVLKTLRAELAGVWPVDGSLPGCTELEKLPYLTACLKESLRLGVGVTSRLGRINHNRAMRYKDWIIPAGASISMSQGFILYDEQIFDDPTSFQPQRWLQGEKSKSLDKWLVAFSKGARGCIGQNLAWAEMYLTLAAVMHRFDLELFHTTREDVDPKLDYFVPFAATGNGVRVLVK